MYREIIFYEDYFDDFYKTLDKKTQEKVDEVLFYLTIVYKIPRKFFLSITGVKGLYEVRVEFVGNIYRIFCCLDKGNLVVLFNGFQKKSQKTPSKEIEKAKILMKRYFDEKEKEDGRK